MENLSEKSNEHSDNGKSESKVKTYFKTLPKRYFITAFSGMALGLFATLLAGTILGTIASWIDNGFGDILMDVSNMAKMLMGAGIGVGIAVSLNKPKLVIFSSAVAGLIGAWSAEIINGTFETVFSISKPGNPIGAYVTTMLCIEIASLYAGKTKFDIIFVPVGILLLSIVGIYVSWPFCYIVNQIGKGIEVATNAVPFIMGLVISATMGLLLTFPTSSAAIWLTVAANNTSDAMLLAGGAAVVGCAAHMVGFAVASFRENGFSGLIAQGIGTSMLQIPNIMKKPVILLPAVISSVIVGPLSTCVFKLKCNAVGGGMGTSGFVGVIGTVTASGDLDIGILIFGIALLMFVIPAIVSLGVSEFMRKKNWIKFGDMKLPD